MLFCPTCGTKCEDGSRFCGNCGTNLEGIASVPGTAAPGDEGGAGGGAAGNVDEPWNPGSTAADTQQAMGSQPWENQAAAGQGVSEPVPPEREESEQMNSVQGETSSAPLRPSQMKKMKEQQRTDQQTAGGSSITIKKPEINVQKYKGSMRRLSKMQIAVIIEAVCLLLVICVFYGLGSSQNSANAVAKRYFQAYVDRDWSKVYDLTDFPDGAYLQKGQFIAMMEQTEVPDVTNFEIMSDKSLESSGVQRNLLVQFTEKGKNADNRVLTLMKQGEKAMLFFDTWKVSPADEIAENFRIYSPCGAAVAIDGTVLPEEDKEPTEDGGMDCYRLTLFAGKHSIQVAVPWHELYEDEFSASAEGTYTAEALKLTEEGETAFAAKMQEALEKVYQSALEQKKFEEISELFLPDYQEACEEAYDSLVSELHDREAYKLKEVEFSDFEYECYDDAYQGMVQAEMSYKYDMKYTYTYTSWRNDTPTTEDKTDDGTSYMSASFQYDEDTYKIAAFSIRSVL